MILLQKKKEAKIDILPLQKEFVDWAVFENLFDLNYYDDDYDDVDLLLVGTWKFLRNSLCLSSYPLIILHKSFLEIIKKTEFIFNFNFNLFA